MKHRDAILTLIQALADQPDLGRTSLQKAAYFLDARYDMGLNHDAYFYGPFSSTVESSVRALVTSGLLNETEHGLGFVGSHGYEGRRYQYAVPESGRQRLAQVEAAHPDDARLIREFANQLVSVVGGLDQSILSAAAKVHYIAAREGQPLDDDQIAQVASQFGWKLNAGQIDRVWHILTGLGPLKPELSTLSGEDPSSSDVSLRDFPP